jgi:glyoxylase-like metal-dependent hydrolase (beta-lactamase superfamily II)
MGYTCRLLRNGGFKLDAGAMFGLIPRVVWTRWLEPDAENRMPLQQNCLLLEGHGRRVIVEVGIGDKFGAKEREMYAMEERSVHDALREAACDPDDVDAVIVTHLHFDHAGGLTRWHSDNGDRTMLTFPNAEIITQRREWEDAIANKSTMHKTYLSTHLTDQVAEHARLVDGEMEVLPGLRVLPCPGHTWGQQAVLIDDDKGRTVCFVPDVMPTRLHARPTCNMAYDVEPYTSMLERTKLLERASDEGWVLVLDHEPGHPAFTARVDPEKPGSYVLEEVEL